MKNVRIIVADNHKLVAQGLKSILKNRPELEVVGFAKGGKQLLKLLKDQEADLVIMDVKMPEMDGIDTMRQLKKDHPRVKVLAHSELRDIEYINSMRIEGAHGYVLKSTDEKELIEAIRMIMNGHKYLSKEVKQAVDRGYDHTKKDMQGAYIGLTDREREVIKLIAEEKTNAEIAEALFISTDTIKTHRKKLMAKLNVRSAAGLVKYAIDRGWVS